jgi:hypothetical protein
MAELIQRPRRLCSLLGSLLLIAGCATLSSAPPPFGWNGAHPVSPPASAPPADDLSQQTQTRRPAGPDRSAAPAPDLNPPRANGPARLELKVEAPRRKQVGSGAEYHLTVHNPSHAAAQNVTIECRFDEKLIFPGKEDKRAIQKLGTLSAGETRQVSLTLASDDPGRHCCDFAVLSEGDESVWKSVCVEFVPRQIEVTLLGPAQRAIGSRAEFNLRIVNVSEKLLPSVTARLNYDPALKAEEATAEAQQQPGSLTWKLSNLKPGEGAQLQAEFTCLEAAEHACLSALVTGSDLPEEQTDACVEITRAVAAGLEMRLLDHADPIDVGDQTGYLTIVQNRSGQPAREVRFEAEIPDNFRVAAVEVKADDRALKLDYQIEGRRITFEPVHQLNPNSNVSFLIQVKALRAGDVVFRAEVSSSLDEERVSLAEQTTINPGRPD